MRLTYTSLAAVLFLASTLWAFNHPELRWKSVTTEHFVINYYDRTEPAVYATSQIAEEAYAALAPLYEYEPRKPIIISLADYDDYSNGWADWTVGAIMIWVPDARMELRNNNTWLRDVVCHELSHILSLEKRKRLQMFDWTLSFSYTSPSLGLGYDAPFARMTLLPEWLVEAASQMGSARMQGDCWDSRRDMLLRCAVLDRRQLSLGEMGVYNHDGLGDEMVYNQGFAFGLYLESALTPEVLRSMYVTAARERVRFDEYFQVKTGHTLQWFYSAWVDSLRQAYGRVVPPQPTATAPVWHKGFLNMQPKVSPDGRYRGWLSNRYDDGYRTDLLITDAATGRVVRTVRYAQTAWCFSADNRRVYYVKSRRTDRHGSQLNDLYVTAVRGGAERRLTHGARIYDVAASPDGVTLAVTQFRDGAFSLQRYAPASGAWSMLVEGRLGEPFMSPCFNPANANELVVARVQSGSSDLCVVDLAARSLRPLLTHRAQEESPSWGRDGRVYFNADYSGIFDIYSVRPDGSDLRRHSRVPGGVFAPAPAADGTLLCSEYTSRGYRIVTLKPVADSALVNDSAGCAYLPLPEAKGKVVIRAEPYRARLLRPLSELQSFADVEVDSRLPTGERYDYATLGTGLQIYRSDALGKKFLTLAFMAGLDAGLYYPNDTAGVGNGVRFSDAPARGAGSRAIVYAPRLSERPDYTPVSPATSVEYAHPTGRTSGPRAGASPFGVQSGSTDTNGYVVIPPSLFLQPVVYYENAMCATSLGFQVGGALSVGGMIMPQLVMVNPFAYWHLCRDLYAGLSPYFEWQPMQSDYYLFAPLWLQWLRQGYTETHAAYTMRNVTDMTVEGGGMLVPGNDGGVGVFVDSVGIRHGLPVGRHASFVLGAGGSIFLGSARFWQPPLDSAASSDLFGQASVSARLVFPIVKNINAGTRMYADALFASLGYEGAILGNRRFITGADRDMLVDVVTGARAFDDARVSHTLEAALTLGVYKDYTFFRTLSVVGSYEVLARKVFVDARMGF
jgi:Tol biopolymer transport system component